MRTVRRANRSAGGVDEHEDSRAVSPRDAEVLLRPREIQDLSGPAWHQVSDHSSEHSLAVTPSRLWKLMTPDQRQRAALAFWRAADAAADQVQAVLLISQQKKF